MVRVIDGAGVEADELVVAAAVEGEFHDAFVVDVTADGRILGLESDTRGDDFDDVGGGANLELDIDAGLLLQLQSDALLLGFFESLSFDCH